MEYYNLTGWGDCISFQNLDSAMKFFYRNAMKESEVVNGKDSVLVMYIGSDNANIKNIKDSQNRQSQTFFVESNDIRFYYTYLDKLPDNYEVEINQERLKFP